MLTTIRFSGGIHETSSHHRHCHCRSFAGAAQAQSPTTILNASYDVAREVFAAENEAFIKLHPGITVDQSHAGTSKQARAIVEGLEADVVTFNRNGCRFSGEAGFRFRRLAEGFRERRLAVLFLPSFLVRAGNPKHIKDWDDLARDDVKVVFPNPKTSGNARYTYLAATAYAKEKFNGDEKKVQEFVKKIFDNTPVFDTGGRAATTTFVEREIGDVLITFEAETRGIAKQYGADKVEGVVPSVSLLAEFPVAVVDKVVDKRGSRELAKSYLDFYTEEGQRIAAEFGHRVHNEKGCRRVQGQVPGHSPRQRQ